MTNFLATDELVVYRNGLKAGLLRRNATGSEFVFSSEFLLQKHFPGISFCMPKSSDSLTNDGVNLFPFFAGLLPEGLRLKALVKNLKTSEDDLFSILAAIGDRVTGDVHVKTDRKRELEPAPKLSQINFYKYFHKIVSEHYTGRDDSIAGVQEKISASMISFPLNIASKKSQYILKLNPADKANLVENEFHCMQLARKCGINTAKTKLVKDKDSNFGLLVTRFDRTWNASSNSFLMHHQEDACQLLNKYPADKYRISFNEIIKGIREHVSAAKIATLKLLELYAFSYLTGNGDLHGKNISLLIKSGSHSAEVTPAYDLICTYIYGDHKMALKLDGRDDNLKRKDFTEFGQRHSIPELATSKMLDRLIKQLSKHSAILHQIPMTERQRNQLTRLMQKRIQDLS